MGGLGGIIHFEGAAPLRDQAAQLSAGVAHRGPDDKGWFAEGPAILVHRSFATMRAQVPEPATTPTTALMADGRPHDLGTGKVLELWEAQGNAAFDLLMGEFALAIWSRDQAVLWLVRDPCGTRPLYWSRRGTKVAFCSELAPLLGLPWVSRELAADHLAEYLSYRYVHAPRTLVRDIQAVPPGHVLRVDRSGVQLDRWWQPRWAPPATPLPEPGECADRVDTMLRRNVERRIAGPADVAVLLSGGLDSSAILYHARSLQKRVSTFTVALHDDQVDESAFAGRVAKVMDTEHHLIRLASGDIIDAIPACSAAMGQPLTSAAAVLQHLLFREIRPSCRIVLSGDGGDEVLGGRGMERIAARLRRNHVFGRTAGPARRLWRKAAGRLGAQDLAVSYTQFGRDRNIGGSRVFTSTERVAVLRDPGMVRPGIRRTTLEPFYQEVDSDPLNDILHTWQRGWLPEDSLVRSDRMGTHQGLDVRTPMLDPSMLRLAASLPGNAKVRSRGTGFVTKAPLREAMRGRLPDPLINRPKRALPNPLAHWLRTDGADFLRHEVDALCADPSGLFLPAEVQRLATEHLSSRADHGLKLWTLTLFQVWRRVVQI